MSRKSENWLLGGKKQTPNETKIRPTHLVSEASLNSSEHTWIKLTYLETVKVKTVQYKTQHLGAHLQVSTLPLMALWAGDEKGLSLGKRTGAFPS